MPSESELPDQLKSFISKYLHSLEELEIIILIFNSGDTLWPVSEVNKYVPGNEQLISRILEELESHGLLKTQKMPGLVYKKGPLTEESASLLKELETAYRERRIQVLNLIICRSDDDLRNFSDAFKIRKERNDS